jgi:hypothetical protein
MSGLGVELESWSKSQFGCPSDRVFARRFTLELPRPRDEELVSHAPIIPSNDDFVFYIVVLLAVVGISHNLKGSTLITSKTYLNGAPYENVNSSQLLSTESSVVALILWDGSSIHKSSSLTWSEYMIFSVSLTLSCRRSRGIPLQALPGSEVP